MAETQQNIKDASNLILEQAKQSRASLDEAKNRAKGASEEISKTNSIIKSGISKLDSISDVMEKALTSVAASDMLFNLLQDTAALKTQQLNIAAYEKAGGSEYQRKLMGELQEEGELLEDLRTRKQDIADDEFTGIGLIDGIIAEIRSMHVDVQIDNATSKFRDTQNTIAAVTAGLEQTNRANILTQEVLTKDSIAKNQQKIAALAEMESAKIERENIHSNASAISTLQTANARAVSAEIEVYKMHEEVAERELRELQRQAALQELDIRLQKAPLEIQQLRTNLARNQNQLQYETNPTTKLALQKKNEEIIKQIDDAQKVEQDASEWVKIGQEILGLPVTEDPAVIQAWRTSRDANEVAKYNLLYIIGRTQSLGATPYDASTALQFVDPLNQGKNTPAKVLIEQTKRRIAEKAKDPLFTAPKDEAAARQLFNDTAKEVRANYHSQINTGDRSNPFHSPPMATLAAMNPVANTKLYKEVLEVKQFKEVDPQLILDSAIEGIKDKRISPTQAANDVAVIFSTAVDYNNKIYGGVQRGGFAPQSQYNSAVTRAMTPFEFATGTAKDVAKEAFGVIPVVMGYRQFKEKVMERPAAGEYVRSYTEVIDLTDATKVREVITKYMSQAQIEGK